MKRLDLIIDELSDICEDVNCQCSIAEALAVARELREMKPVAWVLKMDGEKVIDSFYNDIQELDEGTKLYALGDEK